MATTTYTIYSRSEPQDRKVSDDFPQQLELEPDDWHFDPSLRSKPPPPRFVLASIPLDQDHWAHSGPTSSKQDSTEVTLGTDVSFWYRSLRSLDSSEVHQRSESRPGNQAAEPVAIQQPLRSEKRNKNNWFIMKALQSEPLSENAPSPSLADIIARDPPPLPAEPKYEPPVWLEIGPANKGYEMLQRSGWSEGEPLGPDVIRHHRHEQESSSLEMIPLHSQKRKMDLVKQEIREFKLEGYDDVSEVRRVDVIDLAASDVEDESPAATAGLDTGVRDPNGLSVHPEHSAHSRTALLTPIPIVLKSDRLGIGLKVKTVGPYKASRKRVTHSAAALAAHIKAGEQRKKRTGEVGRGRRGYAKQQKRDEEDRRGLLAYMKD